MNKKIEIILGTDVKVEQYVLADLESFFGGTYILGVPGSGKTQLIVNMILQCIEQKLGLCFIDVHGDAIQDILRRFPAGRPETDVIVLDPLDPDFSFGLNPFKCDPNDREQVSLTINYVLDVFAKLFTTSGSFLTEAPTMEATLRNGAFALIDNYPQYLTTLAELYLLMKEDGRARKRMIENIQPGHMIARDFWEEYENMRTQDRNKEVGMIRRRVERFLSDEHILHIVGQDENTILFRQCMDRSKIILVKLSRQHPQLTQLVGSLIVANIAQAGYSRVNVPENERVPFFLFCDEYQNFATQTFASMLAELRKYKIATVIAHQFRKQLDEINQNAALIARNLIVLQVSGVDGQELAGQFNHPPTTKMKYEKRIREEYKPMPVNIPIDFVLSGHTHTSPIVTNFITSLAPLFNSSKINKGATNTQLLIRAAFDQLNAVLFEVEQEKKALCFVPPQVLAVLAPAACPGYSQHYWRVRPGGYLDYASCTLPTEFTSPPVRRQELYQTEWHYIVNTIVPYKPEQAVLSAYAALWSVPDNALSQAFSAYEKEARYALSTLPFSSPIEQHIQPLKTAFEKTVRTLRLVMRELSTRPLEEASGVLEEVEEVQEREVEIPAQQVRDKIANKLTSPKRPYSARVKLGRTEYTMLTNELRSPDTEAITTARIAKIRKRTALDYATPRETVEHAIQQRHHTLTAPLGVIVDANPTPTPTQLPLPNKRPPRTKQE